jgi:hypothetical protein
MVKIAAAFDISFSEVIFRRGSSKERKSTKEVAYIQPMLVFPFLSGTPTGRELVGMAGARKS